MYDSINAAIAELSGLLWSSPMTLGLLLGTGIYLTVRLGVVQVRAFGIAWESVLHREERAPGEISNFQALSTVLSATVGTGNIAGVATAVTLGGPGALFWMWVTAIFGMATKFAECTLAVRFRSYDADGKPVGGPMNTLLNGLGMKVPAFAFALFAIIASFGIGNMVQSNSVVEGVAYMAPILDDSVTRLALGIVMAALVGAVILGGVKRIAQVASVLVPVMALIYVGAALIVLGLRVELVPTAFLTVIESALSPSAAGGAVVGEAIRYGVARGLFSNEAGLGSSPMAFAATRTNNPVRAGLVSMLGPFIDTLIICTLTGLVIITSGLLESQAGEFNSADLTAAAFQSALGDIGGYVVGIGLALFAFSTMIAWSYYGERCTMFLFGPTAAAGYKVLFILLVALGAVLKVELVWNLADLTNLLMAIPNLLGLLLLAGMTGRMLDEYLLNRELDKQSLGIF